MALLSLPITGLLGNVRLIERFMTHVLITGGCCEWCAGRRYSNGAVYGEFYLPPESKLPAHRASYALFCGDIPENMFVLHSCDNGLCVRPTHFRLGTPQDNMDDMMSRRRGKWFWGDQHRGAKLREADIPVIRQLVSEGRSLQEVAERFGVVDATIGAVMRGKTWSHVK